MVLVFALLVLFCLFAPEPPKAKISRDWMIPKPDTKKVRNGR